MVDDVLVVDLLSDARLYSHFPTGDTLDLSLRRTAAGTRGLSLLVQHVPFCEQETLCAPAP